ncbi:MAG: FAD binding domain-containing protein [Burkholderiales bacterium]|nr:FAD binding domain-containing protein [Burkholderiales bacterium]
MKPSKFEFHEPRSLAEAIETLGRYGEDARILAGGQSLVPLLNFRILQPRALISINHCPELAYLREDNGQIQCGAGTRQVDAERSPVVGGRVPLLAAALPWVGGIANRNRGTVCGSLAHADPLAELPAVALALDAQFRINGLQGAREVPARDFFIGDLTTAVEPGEMLESVRFPCCGTKAGASFVEVGNRAHGFAVVGVAAHLEFDERDRCGSVRLAAIGVGGVPIRLEAAEAILLRADRLPQAAAEAAAVAASGVEPMGGIHADAEYKKELLATLVERAVLKAASAARVN